MVFRFLYNHKAQAPIEGLGPRIDLEHREHNIAPRLRGYVNGFFCHLRADSTILPLR